jgi:hypothetical protein
VTLPKSLLLTVAVVFVANAWGQPSKREPHIGYLYPAGAQQGSSIQILAGGQFLNGASNAYVSGEGVHVKVIQYAKPLNNKDLQTLRARVAQLIKQRQQASFQEDLGLPPTKNDKAAQGAAKPDAAAAQAEDLPDHPLLRNLDRMSLRELQHWLAQFAKARMQPNPQLGEMVVIEVAIDAGAPPGDRELRIGATAGLTNPLRFQVGSLPEVAEQEPNDQKTSGVQPVDLPVMLNGQILPGDVDRFRFRARQGQKLVMEVQARRLIPYLADAVPGWFQATLALYDAKGKEVAFADDYRFDPDPVLFYEVPRDGEYDLEIRDSIFRGREDFVYRIAVGEQPFITHIFPLGGRTGARTTVSISGWNLAEKKLALDTGPGGGAIRQTALCQGKCLSNCVSYAVDTLPGCDEDEKNNDLKHAQRISLPRIVNGRIDQPDDVDVFRFKGSAGDGVVAEVYARRLNSPLDSLLQLIDESGRVLEWNDDHEDKEAGLLTHQADSYLRTRLPENGVYYVQLTDAQHDGGEEYAYRLRIGPPRPDFALRLTPSSLSVPAGRSVPVTVHVSRKDGFDGDIEVALTDAPAGFKLDGGRIPGDRDSIRMTLTAPREPLDQPAVLHLEGRAQIAGQAVIHGVVPAEYMMQAFAYMHLAPWQELMAAVTGARRPAPLIELASETPIQIPGGGTGQVQIRIPKGPMLEGVTLILSDPPKGITLQDTVFVPGVVTVILKAEGEAAKPGYADNLIIEASREVERKQQDAKAAKQKQRVSLGILPAIPFEIVQP